MPNKYPKSDTGPVYTNKKTGKKSLTRPKDMKEEVTDPKVLFGSDYDKLEPLPAIMPDSAAKGKLIDGSRQTYDGSSIDSEYAGEKLSNATYLKYYKDLL